MKVSDMIIWLKTQPQHLEVCVLDYDDSDYSTDVQSVCFDDPHTQSTVSEFCLTLGVIR